MGVVRDWRKKNHRRLKKRLLRMIVNSWWIIQSVMLRDGGVIDSVRL
jgi:hypothetical protein